jgi:hypothetical protein
MKYIVKQPNEAPQVLEAEKISLKIMQEAVGGLITTAFANKLSEAGIDMFANDEGLLIGLEPNLGFEVYGHPTLIVGGVILVAADEEGETIGLTDEQIKVGLEFLKESSGRIGEILLKARLMGR